MVVEAKAASQLLPVHEAQLMTYLKVLNKPLGILLNFHVEKIMEGGFKRRANTVH